MIVRTQEAKRHLPPEFQGALVMTVFEAKGLEFDDVFLWDFFHDSPCSEEWRLVVQYLREGKGDLALNTTDPLCPRAIKFSRGKHQIMCEELKHFYTAITRARGQLIIYDHNKEKRSSMFFFLQSQVRDTIEGVCCVPTSTYVLHIS